MKQTIVISWGRMNPPTTGHELLVKHVQSIAKMLYADSAIYLSKSQDRKKNPLSYEDKLFYAQKAFGRIIKDTKAKNIIQLFQQIEKKYPNMVLVVGQDRVPEFDEMLRKYNGKEFHFQNYRVVSAGERDPDADDLTGMSASKLRKLAAEKDFNAFKEGLPKKLAPHAIELYNKIRENLNNITELNSISYVEESKNMKSFLDELKDVKEARGDYLTTPGKKWDDLDIEDEDDGLDIDDDSDEEPRRRESFLDKVRDVNKLKGIGEARKAKGADDAAEGDTNILMQLRKSISLRGQKDVKFENGDVIKVPAMVANKALQMYLSLDKPAQKEAFMNKISKSYGALKAATGAGLKEAVDMDDQEIPNDIPDNSKGDGNVSDKDVKNCRHIAIDLMGKVSELKSRMAKDANKKYVSELNAIHADLVTIAKELKD